MSTIVSVVICVLCVTIASADPISGVPHLAVHSAADEPLSTGKFPNFNNSSGEQRVVYSDNETESVTQRLQVSDQLVSHPTTTTIPSDELHLVTSSVIYAVPNDTKTTDKDLSESDHATEEDGKDAYTSTEDTREEGGKEDASSPTADNSEQGGEEDASTSTEDNSDEDVKEDTSKSAEDKSKDEENHMNRESKEQEYEESLSSVARNVPSLATLIENELRVDNRSDNMNPNEKFIALIDKIKKMYNLVAKDVTPILFEKILTVDISIDCVSALAKSYEAINKNKQWVFSSKII